MIIDLISYYGFAVPALHCLQENQARLSNQQKFPRKLGTCLPGTELMRVAGPWSCKDHEWVVGEYIRILEAVLYIYIYNDQIFILHIKHQFPE